MNEMEAAQAVREGLLPSPTRFANMTLFALRVTSTGASYRKGLNEYVWRDPSLYLNDDFVARVSGLPIIWEHPETSVLNSKEFGDRVIGTAMFGYIQGEDVWCVARLYDDVAIKAMTEGQLSTSPTVVIGNNETNPKLDLNDGAVLLIEDEPSLLCHLAVVANGVWDKGQAPSGVKVTELMKDQIMAEKKPDDDETAGAVGTGDKMDQMLSLLEGLSGRMDSVESHMKADAAAKADKAKADAENNAAGAKEKEATVTPEKVAADKAKADEGKDPDEDKDEDKKKPAFLKSDKKADEDKEEDKDKKADKKADEEKKDPEDKKEDAVRKDTNSEIMRKIADFDARTRSLSDADMDEMADAHAKADGVFQAFGGPAPRHLTGETPLAYRRRLLNKFKTHSPQWKDVDLAALDVKVLKGIAEPMIYADAMVASNAPMLGAGALRLRERRTTDATGRMITTFHGDPNIWLNDFKCARQRVTGFNTKGE